MDGRTNKSSFLQDTFSLANASAHRRRGAIIRCLSATAVALGTWLFSAQPAAGVEVQALGGYHKGYSLSGCCKSPSAAFLGGFVLRTEARDFRFPIEIAGISTEKWSEFTVGLNRYLVGMSASKDPASTDGIELTYQSNTILLWSNGVGLAIQNLKSTNYDLPALVIGVLPYTRLHLIYNWSDRFAFVGSAELAVSISSNQLSTGLWSAAGVILRF